VAAGVAPSAPAQAEGQKSIDCLKVATDFEDCVIRYGRESERGLLLADARIDVPVLDWYKEAV